ncbi:MAG: N-acetyl-gamma-glutamyl-phosphate reductase, partial [Planctomycetes bacterium]|nr:N-acetyl-gamma-glutamyl-phosphate reductase [Planctomycetota bacterium]
MTRVAILGATGYTALELIKILLRHPQAQITMLTSRQEGQPHLSEVHPSLTGRLDLRCEPFRADRVAKAAECVFSTLPHTASMEACPALLERGCRVIDLSADYRLSDPNVYAEWYGASHTDLNHLREAVYGLPEIYGEEIRSARLIANPGCYPTAAILGLAPLAASDMIELKGIVVDAKSGVSGAGRTPKLAYHFPECNESTVAYNVGKHRHTPEMDQILGEIAGSPAEVLFTPHLVPMDRGIFTTIYARPKRPFTEAELLDIYRSYYSGAPFVRIVPQIPATKDSAG